MASAQDKRAERRGGFYWVGSEPYPTVTTILQVKNKPALLRWHMEQVYWAVVKNPSISKEEALMAPGLVSNDAKTRGTTVHSIVEHYTEGASIEEVLAGIPEAYQGYAKAFHNWINNNDFTVIQHEKTVVSTVHKFAGTLDMLARNKKSGEIYLIDVKTGKQIYREAFYQLSAYKEALREEGIKVDKLAVLLLSDKGVYNFGTGSDRLKAFLAAKTLWEDEQEELLSETLKG
jgi:PD-(D/E)XK nuclease superfamily